MFLVYIKIKIKFIYISFMRSTPIASMTCPKEFLNIIEKTIIYACDY